jgi:hypothetical protein
LTVSPVSCVNLSFSTLGGVFVCPIHYADQLVFWFCIPRNDGTELTHPASRKNITKWSHGLIWSSSCLFFSQHFLVYLNKWTSENEIQFQICLSLRHHQVGLKVLLRQNAIFNCETAFFYIFVDVIVLNDWTISFHFLRLLAVGVFL